MSVRVMTAVFDRYPNGGGEMLLALCLADHAHDDGTHIYPSVGSLARKSRQSVRSVQYQLKEMTTTGWLLLTNEGDGRRGQHREYRISPEWLKGAEFASLQNTSEIAPEGANDDCKGCSVLHPLYNHVEPSVNRQSAATCKPGKATRISGDWELPAVYIEFAVKTYDWTPEFAQKMGDKFRDHWCALPGKSGLKTHWLATWRNHCRSEADFIARTARLAASGRVGSFNNGNDQIIEDAARYGLNAKVGESGYQLRRRLLAHLENLANPNKTAIERSIIGNSSGPVKVESHPEISAPSESRVFDERQKALGLVKNNRIGRSYK